MIRFTTGDIFESQAEALVNTVNLNGVMGKGIALQFKKLFKENFRQYQKACADGTIQIGESLVVPEAYQGRKVYIVNFPTKIHWRNPSQYVYVEKGLDNLVSIINDYHIGSIAIPPLGAGNGKLEWPRVKEMIVDRLKNVDSDILVYEPGYVQQSADKEIALTPARSLLVYMLERIQREGMDATAFAAVKSVYFMQKFGAEGIFQQKFVKYYYGPYSDGVRHILHALDGAYIRGFYDQNKRPFEPFDLIHEKTPEIHDFVSHDILLSDIADSTCGFLDGYWDDFGLELLSSVDFLMSERPEATVEDIVTGLQGWSERKAKLFCDRESIEQAYYHVKKVK